LSLSVAIDELLIEGQFLVCEETESKTAHVVIDDRNGELSVDGENQQYNNPINEFDVVANEIGAFMDFYREQKPRTVQVTSKKKRKSKATQ
jgi:hypothetical protein